MMRADDTGHEDPQWALTLEIASKLWFEGRCTLEVVPTPHQRVVDVHWAALQAGRLLGVRARVRVVAPFDRAHPTVTMEIVFDDLDGRARVRAEEGLEKLLRAVSGHPRR